MHTYLPFVVLISREFECHGLATVQGGHQSALRVDFHIRTLDGDTCVKTHFKFLEIQCLHIHAVIDVDVHRAVVLVDDGRSKIQSLLITLSVQHDINNLCLRYGVGKVILDGACRKQHESSHKDCDV